MPFKITIEQTKEVIVTTGKEYQVIGEEEVARNPDYLDSDDEKTRIQKVYGYTPEIEKRVTVTDVVLVQRVEVLDLARVIKAINGLD